jgi:branched-chain amino acid transport system permease protein
VLAILVVTVIVLTLLAHSHWGLLLRAIRGDEATCQAAGINVTFYKIASLAISAAFAGLGGALYAHYQLQVSPPLFSVVVSITVIIMCYVGGIGSIYGAAIAAILLTLLTEMLRGFGEYRLWIYTLTLMLILFFLPNGMIAPFWRRLTERFR